jgi:L-ascorbate oxidase
MDQVRNMVEGYNGITRDFTGPLKDTVLVPGRGFTVIRFYADNPGTIKMIGLSSLRYNMIRFLGYWLFHCHISEHMALGMALAFKVGFHSEMKRPPTNFPRCGNYF